MNKVALVGRVANNLELRATQKGYFVCEFNLATNRPVKNEERKADFITCVVWGKPAENLANYQDKGSLIGIIGSLRTDTYDKSDGTKGYKTYVLVSEVEFLGAKKNNETVVKTDTEVLKEVIEETNPYEEFGQQIQIDESLMDELPF